MSDEVLRPCPICGKKVSIARTDNEVGERWWFITRGTYRTTRCNCRLFLESAKFTCDWKIAQREKVHRYQQKKKNCGKAVKR